MEISDLPRHNSANACCGCGFPACDENTVKCQSLSHTSTCADDDYTDDLAEWEDGLNAWLSELIDEWFADLAEWLAEDPEREPGDYPVPPPEERDPEDYPTPEPEKPDGYDDVTHGCFLPYVKPDGLDTAEIPTIYRTLAVTIKTDSVDGEGYAYYNVDFGGGVGYEALGHTTIADNVETFEGTGNEVTEVGGGCTPSDGSAAVGAAPPLDGVWDELEPTLECTANSRVYSQVDTISQGSMPLELEGCPGPWTSTPYESMEVAYSYIRTNSETYTLGSGISKSDLIDRAIANLPDTWPDEAEGSACMASTSTTWPIISDGFVGADPEADPPVEGAWRTCESGALGTGNATATATKSRYKHGIPLFMQAHRLWEIAHAEWVTEGSDPETEPVEPQIYHYYAIQWDVVKFPKAWDAWSLLYNAWKTAVAAHDDWEEDYDEWVENGSDPETEPEEPAVPTDPSEDQPDNRPTFIDENLFWQWNGGETEAEQYEEEWHYIAAVSEEARVSIVNKQSRCMESARTGVPPTFHGEIYNPDDYPE